MKLEISVNGSTLFELDAEDNVLVPTDEKERALCREALQSALQLLADTVVTRSTFSTAVATDEVWKQSGQHPDGCLSVFYSAPPSEQPAGNLKPSKRPLWSPSIVDGTELRDL